MTPQGLFTTYASLEEASSANQSIIRALPRETQLAALTILNTTLNTALSLLEQADPKHWKNLNPPELVKDADAVIEFDANTSPALLKALLVRQLPSLTQAAFYLHQMNTLKPTAIMKLLADDTASMVWILAHLLEITPEELRTKIEREDDHGN